MPKESTINGNCDNNHPNFSQKVATGVCNHIKVMRHDK